LIALGEKLEEAFIDRQIGSTVEVVMEDDGTGYTGNYVRVRCEGTCGETVRVRLTGREGTIALGSKE
jgi:hypothetical protein